MKRVFKTSNIIFRLLSTWLITFIACKIITKDTFYNISFASDLSLPIIILIFFITFIILTIISYFLKKENFEYILAIILYTICSIYWSFSIRNAFFLLTLFLLFILLYKYKLESIKMNIQISNKTTMVIVALSAIIMFSSIAIVTVLRYKTFSASNFDLGIPSQNFYYMKKTLIPYSTTERNQFLSHFAVHISPIYYLGLPIYAIFSSPTTLQLLAALLIASGIIPIYLICKNKKFSNIIILLLCLLYALYAPAICSTFYDFHENTFLTPLLLWLFYFYEKKNYKLYWLALLLVLFVKEDAPLYIIIFGIYTLFDNNKKLGITTTLIGLIYFIAVNIILTHIGEGPMSYRYENLILDNEGMLGAIKTIISNPGYFLNQLTLSDPAQSAYKIEYLLLLFLPLGFIPFKHKQWKNYILLTPLLLTIMTTYIYCYLIDFHYSNGVVAFIFYLMILNVKEFKKYNYLFVCLFGSILVYTAEPYNQISKYSTMYYKEFTMYNGMETFLKNVPKDASVNASGLIVAHLANRDTLYEILYHDNEPDVDYVVLDGRIIDEYNDVYDAYISNGYYEYKKSDNITILKDGNN